MKNNNNTKSNADSGNKKDNNNNNNRFGGKRINYSKLRNVRLLELENKDLTNFGKWRKELQVYLYENFKEIGSIIEFEQEVVFAQPDFAAVSEFATYGVKKMFEAQLKVYMEKTTAYNGMKPSAFSATMESLSEESKDRVLQQPEFEQLNKDKDILKLYLLIKKMHLGTHGGLKVTNIVQRQQVYNNIRQYPDESVRAYVERFKEAVNVLKAIGITPDAEDIQAAKFIHGLDNGRFTDLKTNLYNDGIIYGADSYPNTVAKAAIICQEYLTRKPSGGVKPAAVAFVAKGAEEKQPEKKQKKKEVTCWACKQKGHFANQCPTVKKSKGDNNEDEDHNTATVRLMKCQVSPTYVTVATAKKGNRKKTTTTEILLDNQASKSVFSNHSLVSNVRKAPVEMLFNGVGGILVAKQIADYELFNATVYFNDNAGVNVLSWSELRRRDDIQMNHNSSDDFCTLQYGGKTYFFDETNEGLYAMRGERARVAVTTVENNMSNFSHREIADAKKVVDLTKRLGVPSNAAVSQLIKSGQVKGVTLRDLERAEVIYGPSVAALKGKETEPEPIRMHLERAMNREVINLQAFSDLMFVGEYPFLITVLKPIGLIMCSYLGKEKAKSKENLRVAIISQINTCKAHGFLVSVIHSDGEKGLVALKDELAGLGVICNAATGMHVGDIEVVIKVVKTWARGVVTTLPWKLPPELCPKLVSFVVQRLNLFASKRGIPNRPAIEVFTGVGVDIDRDARVCFGEYCQMVAPNLAARGKKNDVFTPRTEGGVALQQSGRQGSVEFLSLVTLKVVVRNKFTILPTTVDVVTRMNEVAAAQIGSGLKFVLEDDDDRDATVDADLESYKLIPEVNMQQQSGEIIENATDDSVSEMISTEVEDSKVADVDDDIVVADENMADILPESNNEQQSEAGDQAISGETTDEQQFNPGVSGVVSDEVSISIDPEPPPATRRSTRGANRVDYAALNDPRKRISTNIAYGYNISVKKALTDMKSDAEKSIKGELLQIVDKNVFAPVRWEELSAEDRGRTIRSFMFLKQKYRPDGSFEKLKARLVANGANQDKSLYADISSPTAAVSSLYMVAALAAMDKRMVCTADITGAYLNARMPEDGNRVYMIIEPMLANLLVELRPTYGDYKRGDGSLVVRLDGALYGCIESAKLWNERIAGFLLSIGFTVNKMDACVFNKGVGDEQVTVLIYVDDLFISTKKESDMKELEVQLIKEFGSVKFNYGKVHGYLGMVFDYSVGGKVSVSMEGYVEDLMQFCAVEGVDSVPARECLYKVGDSGMCAEVVQETFHSVVAKVLYVAKRTRPDVLQATAYLATRVGKANYDDVGKINRLLRYLNGTKSLGICFKVTNGEMKLDAYADAAFGVHVDGKSHSGLVICFGGGPIFTRSSKQKLVTKSSWEAELVSLSDGGSQLIWTRNFLIEQGVVVPCVDYFEDNTGTIASINKGRPSSDSSRHVNIKYFWLKERIGNEMDIKYIPTELMKADIMTKPLQGDKFRKLRYMLMNNDSDSI